MLFVTKRGMCTEGFTEMHEKGSDLLSASASFTKSEYKVKETLKTCNNFQEPVTHNYCETCQDLLELYFLDNNAFNHTPFLQYILSV